MAGTVRQNTRCQLVQYDETKHDQDCCLRPKETIPNAPRTCNRLCWRKCQRFVIVSPWYAQFHLAVSVNMITGIKHRQPRATPRELQLTAELHGVISQLYRSPLRSSAIEPSSLAPAARSQDTSRGRHCHRHRSSVACKEHPGCRFEFLRQKAISLA